MFGFVRQSNVDANHEDDQCRMDHGKWMSKGIWIGTEEAFFESSS
jgi:hypothetical protein